MPCEKSQGEIGWNRVTPTPHLARGFSIHLQEVLPMSQQVMDQINYKESMLYRIRHSASLIMAQAVLEIFPDGKIAIRPPIDDGFYYGLDLPRNLTPEDLEAIEARMKEIIKGDFAFERREVSAAEAKKLFKGQP